MGDGDAEQGSERRVAGAAAVEAEDEFIEVGLEVLATQPVIDAQSPDLEVGEDAVDPGQDNVGGHLADDMGIVGDAGGPGVAGPTVGLGSGAGRQVGGEKGMQAGGRIIGHLAQTDAAGAGTAVLHLNGADNQHFALMAAPAAARQRIVFAAADDFGFVDFDEAGEQAAAGGQHAAAQLGADQPSRLVGAEGELTLQLQGRDAVGVGGHQISGPEPDGQRQFGVMHDSPGGDRGLAAAAGALISPGFGLQLPSFVAAAARASEAIGPARGGQILGASSLLAEALLELEQGAGKVGHQSHRERVMFVICSITKPPRRRQHFGSPDAQGLALSRHGSPI